MGLLLFYNGGVLPWRRSYRKSFPTLIRREERQEGRLPHWNRWRDCDDESISTDGRTKSVIIVIARIPIVVSGSHSKTRTAAIDSTQPQHNTHPSGSTREALLVQQTSPTVSALLPRVYLEQRLCLDLEYTRKVD